MRKIFTPVLRLSSKKLIHSSFAMMDNKITQRRLFASTSLLAIGAFGFSSAISLNDYYELTVQDDLKEGEMREYQVGPQKEDAVLLCKVDNRVYCVSNQCSHYGAPLASGLLVGDKVKCPWHNASFSVKDGAMEGGPMLNGIETFPVQVTGNQVSVRIPKDKLNRRRQLNMVTRGDDPTHFVIVGGGPAGLSAAESLRQGGFQGRITILTAEENLPYDRTPISKGVLGFKKENLTIRNQEFFDKYGIEVQTKAFVDGINVEKQQVSVKGSGAVNYDKLLIATGGSARRPKAKGVQLQNVFTLRTAQDGEAIRQAAQGAKNIVVVGASFIGLETAAAIKGELKDKVNITVVGAQSVPFEQVLGREVGKAIQALHEQNGVHFVSGARVTEVRGEQSAREVLVSSGQTLEADLVVLGAGIEPNVGFVQGQLPLAQNGGIQADVFLKASNNVYVAGDVASYPYWATGQNVRIEHHNEAIHQGYIAAMNMLGRPTPLTTVPYFWTRHYTKSLQYSGVGQGFDEVIIDGDLTKLEFVAYYARKGHIVASASVGVPNAQQIISEALRLNVVPPVAEFKRRKMSVDDLKREVQLKGPSCNCRRAGECQSKL